MRGNSDVGDDFRAQIERLLALARTHVDEGRVEEKDLDSLRMAVARNRREGISLREAWTHMPGELERVGDGLVLLLKDADSDAPAEVAQLEQLIQDRLDVGL